MLADKFLVNLDQRVCEETGCNFEYEYPYFIKSGDGLYHLVYSWNNTFIKFRREGTEVEVLGLNEASATIVDRFGVHDKPDAIDQLMGH